MRSGALIGQNSCIKLKTFSPYARQPIAKEPFVRTFARPLTTPSCNDATPATKPDRASPLAKLAAVATPPLRANSTGYRVCLSHRCIAAAARAIHRSQERPPRLKSGGTQVQLAARRRGRAHNLELARAPCGCKAAQLRSPKPQHFRDAASEAATLKDAQGPVQKATKARPAPSFGKTRSGL